MQRRFHAESLSAYQSAAGWLALLTLAVLAGWLRLSAVGENPGWYTDEGTHLAIARSLLTGHVGYLAVDGSTVLFAKLPLFDWLLALAAQGWGLSMGTARGLAAGLGVLSVVLLYAGIRALTRRPLWALLPALILAILPPAVLFSRMAFSYNLLTPLLLITWLCLATYAGNGRPRMLAMAALALGVGGLTDLWAWTALPILAGTVLLRQRRHLWWALLLAASPSIIYAAWLFVADGTSFLFDLRYTLERLGGADLRAQLGTLRGNLTVLLFQDPWLVLALIGLWRLPFARGLTLAFLLLPILLLGRTVALFHLSAYYMIPLLPFVALGVAQFLTDAVRYLIAWAQHRVRRPMALRYAAAGLAIMLFTVLPVTLLGLADVQRVGTGWETALEPFLVPSDDALAAVSYVNSAAQLDELTIASPTVAWLIEGRAADFQMAVAATGVATPHLPANLPASRWRFDARFEAARFLIVDNLWTAWASVHVPGINELLTNPEGWTLRASFGDVRVYERSQAP